jgi:GNAT superfamily N-acetyltransferase
MIEIVPVETRHRADWERLFAGYAAFYRVAQTPKMRETVWRWLHDPAHEVNGLVAEDAARRVHGIAHWRRFARPLRAGAGIFLDDLFVDPAHRGSGAGEALIAELRAIAAREGCSVVRWITADDNSRARALYDRVAARTTWITYDAEPSGGATPSE